MRLAQALKYAADPTPDRVMLSVGVPTKYEATHEVEEERMLEFIRATSMVTDM